MRTIQIVIKGLVTEFEYENLRGLAAPVSYMVQELNRLDAIRCVRPTPGYGIESIRERDGTDRKFHLKEYVQITDDGLAYLRFRDGLLRSPA